MKTEFLFLVSIFLLTMIGCREDIIVPGPDPVLKSTLLAWATPESVAYKGTATIYWQSENLSCLSINGRVYPELTGSVAMTGLVKDTIFNFKGTSIDGLFLNESIHIKVGPAPVVVTTPTNAKDTLVSMYWMLVADTVFMDNGKVYVTELSEARKTKHLHFYVNDEWVEFDRDDRRLTGGKFEIKGDSLRMEHYWYKFVLASYNETIKLSLIMRHGSDVIVSSHNGFPYLD